MNVFPNPTLVLLQMLPFLGVLLVLKYVILDPLLMYLEARDRHTTGATDDVSALSVEANELDAQCEARMKANREAAHSARAVIMAEAHKTEQGILTAAQGDLDAEVTVFRQSLQAELETVRTELKGDATKLASNISHAILGQSAQG